MAIVCNPQAAATGALRLDHEAALDDLRAFRIIVDDPEQADLVRNNAERAVDDIFSPWCVRKLSSLCRRDGPVMRIGLA